MDLTQLANLGEFIGGITVLVTLVYLAVQVRNARGQMDQQSLSTTLQTIYDAWEPIYLEENLNILRRGMEDTGDLNTDETLKYNLFMMRILGPVLALERCDDDARRSLVPFLRQFFSVETGAQAWLDGARDDPGLAPMVGAYDRMVAEYCSPRPQHGQR